MAEQFFGLTVQTPQLKQTLREAEYQFRTYGSRFSRNAKVAYRRGMGAFRRQLIKKSPILKDSTGGRRRGKIRGKGQMDRAFSWAVTGNHFDELDVRFWTESKAAFDHETAQPYGAQRSRHLAIPTGFALKTNGQPKKRYKNFRKFASGFRQKSTFAKVDTRKILRLVPMKYGGYAVYEQHTKGNRKTKTGRVIRSSAKYRLVYLLIKRVKGQKKNLQLMTLWRDIGEPLMVERLAQAFDATIMGKVFK